MPVGVEQGRTVGGSREALLNERAHLRDQEMPIGAPDRWQDEDHYTNRSGDARIGTHGRSYEPGEQPASTANDNRRR